MKSLVLMGLMSLATVSAFAGNGQVGSVGGDQQDVLALKGTVQIETQSKAFSTIIITDVQTIAASSDLDKKRVTEFTSSGVEGATSAKSGIEVSDCKEAVLVLKVGEGNIIPFKNGDESYAIPTILSFTCVNK